MPNEIQVFNPPHDEKYKSYQEVERLIAFAEDLRANIFRLDKSNTLIKSTITATWGLGAVLFCVANTAAGRGWGDFYFFSIQLVIIGSVLVISMFLVQSLRANLGLRSDDEHAMLKIVDMLREIEGAIAAEYNLTILERVELQARLSRFGIGPGVRGAGTSVPNS